MLHVSIVLFQLSGSRLWTDWLIAILASRCGNSNHRCLNYPMRNKKEAAKRLVLIDHHSVIPLIVFGLCLLDSRYPSCCKELDVALPLAIFKMQRMNEDRNYDVLHEIVQHQDCTRIGSYFSATTLQTMAVTQGNEWEMQHILVRSSIF